MGSLSIRRLDRTTIERLRVRAAQHGVSMEEEARQILRRTVSAPEQLGELALELFGPDFGVELKLPQHPPHEPMDFSK